MLKVMKKITKHQVPLTMPSSKLASAGFRILYFLTQRWARMHHPIFMGWCRRLIR